VLLLEAGRVVDFGSAAAVLRKPHPGMDAQEGEARHG